MHPEPPLSRDWRDVAGFYPSEGRCCICGSAHMIGQEPRFNYLVCEEHSKLSPIEVNLRRSDNNPASR